MRLCRLLRERSGGEPRGSDSYSDLSHVSDVSDLPVDVGTYDDARRYWYTSKLAAQILVSPYSLVLSSAIHRGQGPFLKMDSALVPSIHQLWPTQTFCRNVLVNTCANTTRMALPTWTGRPMQMELPTSLAGPTRTACPTPMERPTLPGHPTWMERRRRALQDEGQRTITQRESERERERERARERERDCRVRGRKGI